MGNPPTKGSVHKGHNAVNHYFIAPIILLQITYNDPVGLSYLYLWKTFHKK
jgi:hypothetical protein